jgi:signal transduction histidine kinase
VRTFETSPVLADAVHILTVDLRKQVERLATLLGPATAKLDRAYGGYLRRQHFDPKQRKALSLITPGALVSLIAQRSKQRRVSHASMLAFVEQVEYNGRRLAKLNVQPGAILAALAEYDRRLEHALRSVAPPDAERLRWLRERLHFLVVMTLNTAFYQVREAETQAYSSLFGIELESRSLENLLGRSVATLSQYGKAQAAGAWFLNPGGTEWLPVAWTPRNLNDRRTEPQPVPNTPDRQRALARPFCRVRDGFAATDDLLLDPSWGSFYRTCWSMPLRAGRRLIGVIQFGFVKDYEWLPRERDLLQVAAERCSMAAEKARLLEDLADREEQIRTLATRMLQVEEVERRRISRELHDEAGQSMLCIRLQLEMIEHEMPEQWKALRAKLGDARQMTEHTILEMRRLIAALSPAVLEQLGLAAAIRQLVARFQRIHTARVRLQLSRLGALPKKMESILYRLVQECFNNIGKHSGANHVNISLCSADGIVRLQVEDDGVGFRVDEALAKRDSFGLAGLRERVALLGGTCSVESRPRGSAEAQQKGSGTRIEITLQLPREAKVA